MNELLVKLYKKLSEVEKMGIKERFVNSPVILQILHFIDQLEGESFSNQIIIGRLYEKDLKVKTYREIDNRYLKHRKKILDVLHEKEVKSVALPFTEEETLVYQLLRGYTQPTEIHKQKIAQLKLFCSTNNIFELWARIIDWEIQTHHRKNSTVIHKLFKERDRVNALLQKCNKLVAYRDRAHEMEKKYGELATYDYLYKMNTIAKKNKNYPRFRLMYLLTALENKYDAYSKYQSKQYNNLLSRYRKLRLKHPNMPEMEFSPHYKQKGELTMLRLEAKGRWLSEDFEACELFYEEYIKKCIYSKNHRHLTIPRGVFNNLISVKSILKKYKESLSVIDTLEKYAKKYYTNTVYETINTQKALILIDSFPNTNMKIIDDVIAHIRSELERSKGKENNTLYLHKNFLLALLLFINHEYTKAYHQLCKVATKNYISHDSNYDVYQEIFKQAATGNVKMNPVLYERLSKLYEKEKKFNAQLQYKWLITAYTARFK